MIEAKNISKSFGNIKVLNDISFTIPKSQVVTIVGSSGAGKTTLLQILGTLLKPDSGEVWLKDENILKYDAKKTAELRNKEIGFVFQFHNLLPEFTALENVALPALILGTPKKEAFKRAEELLEFLSLKHRLQHQPSALSGGEQQRVAVARSLINKPSVVLADEPSGNLDSKHKNELHQLFFDLRESFKQTFIIVTHDNELAKLSDRTLHMKDGILL